MWRYLVGAIGALAIAAAVTVLAGRPPSPQALLPSAAAFGAAGQAPTTEAAIDPPEAAAKTREERRFGRYDKDRNGAITRAEYLAPRQKAYARLDVNHDGALSFDEWAVKTTTRFADADADRNAVMTPAEFATTAPKRNPRARPKCACPPTADAAPDEG